MQVTNNQAVTIRSGRYIITIPVAAGQYRDFFLAFNKDLLLCQIHQLLVKTLRV